MELRRVAFAAALLVVAGGCRYKGGESFLSATTPNPVYDRASSDWKGDPYAGSESGDATGGVKVEPSSAKGARARTKSPTDPSTNVPAYGTGQRPGELDNAGMPGHDRSNAPIHQPAPSNLATDPRQ